MGFKKDTEKNPVTRKRLTMELRKAQVKYKEHLKTCIGCQMREKIKSQGQLSLGQFVIPLGRSLEEVMESIGTQQEGQEPGHQVH